MGVLNAKSLKLICAFEKKEAKTIIPLVNILIPE
jgi:hypothetical protein